MFSLSVEEIDTRRREREHFTLQNSLDVACFSCLNPSLTIPVPL